MPVPVPVPVVVVSTLGSASLKDVEGSERVQQGASGKYGMKAEDVLESLESIEGR
jgi:hypothetical protein